MKRGTILFDSGTQCLVEITSINKDKTWYDLTPLWAEPGNRNRSTGFGRSPEYIAKYCKKAWIDFPVSKKKIKKNPMFQFHDNDAWDIEFSIEQPFLRMKEYSSCN